MAIRPRDTACALIRRREAAALEARLRSPRVVADAGGMQGASLRARSRYVQWCCSLDADCSLDGSVQFNTGCL